MTSDEILSAIVDAIEQHASDVERINAIRIILAERSPLPNVNEALAAARAHAAKIPAETSAVGANAKAAIRALALAVESLQQATLPMTALPPPQTDGESPRAPPR